MSQGAPSCLDGIENLTLVAENGTEGDLWLGLMTSPSGPWHENETIKLGLRSRAWAEEPEESDSVRVLMGVGGLGEPGCTSTTYLNSTEVDDPHYLVEAILNCTLTEGPVHLLAQVSFRNETLNVSHQISVGPSRMYLVPEVVEPEDARYQELDWTPTDLLLVNLGGRGATNLVLDVRYGGRVVDTFEVPYIPPFGNYSLRFTLMPLHGHDRVDVVPLNGPGANSPLSPPARVYVEDRTVLDVVSLTATPGDLEPGERVHIEALVRNRGNTTSGGEMVELMVDGTVVSNVSVEGLEPGAERTVTTDWPLRGTGTHTISARAEGDDFAAVPVAVEVVAPAPAVGAFLVLAALALAGVTRAARRW